MNDTPPPKQSTNPLPSLGPTGRAVGLDLHPDTFAAAILSGRDPLQARVVQSITRQPLEALPAWVARHTTVQDVLILEASANSFTLAERLSALDRQVFILESHRAGQIGKSSAHFRELLEATFGRRFHQVQLKIFLDRGNQQH